MSKPDNEGLVRPGTKSPELFYSRKDVAELEQLGIEGIRLLLKEISSVPPRSKGAKRSPLLQGTGSDLSEGARSIIREIALARKAALEKFTLGHELFFTREGLRWATPEAAARHCAARLSGEHCLDVSCGQGGQVLFLAEACKRVTAYDIDPLNCMITRLNMFAMGLDNIAVHNLDCLSPEAVEKADEGCLVFSDPARPPGSAERTLEELGPDPRKVLDAYGGSASGFCFELPPFMDLEKIAFRHEAEYVSLNGRLNRLNVYTGSLARSQRSVVVLPSGVSISGPPSSPPPDDVVLPFPEIYMHEVEHAVVRAGLVAEMVKSMGLITRYIELDDRRSVLLTNTPLVSPFLMGCYRVLAFASDMEGTVRSLRMLGAGKVTPRYRMDPVDYWKERKQLEMGLDGDIWVHLFRKGQFIIAQRLGAEGPQTPEDPK